MDGKNAASLEKEIIRLQDVLKEREAEITLLEESLKAAEANVINSFAIAPPLLHIESGDGDNGLAAPIGDHPAYGNRSGRSTPVSSSPIPPVNLSPKTMNQFKAIRNSLDLDGFIKSDGGDEAPPLGQDNLLGRLNELMRLEPISLCCADLMIDAVDAGRWLRRSPAIRRLWMISMVSYLRSRSSTTNYKLYLVIRCVALYFQICVPFDS